MGRRCLVAKNLSKTAHLVPNLYIKKRPASAHVECVPTNNKVRNSDQLYVRLCRTVSGMKKSHLTRKQVLSVRCPTCHVAAGKPCVLSAGGLRVEPHADRKYLASEDMEKKRTKKS